MDLQQENVEKEERERVKSSKIYTVEEEKMKLNTM